MANEITYTGHGNLFLAAALNREIHEILSDQTDLRSVIQYMGSVNGTGSAVSKVAEASWGDAMAAANADEVTAPGYTDLTNATVSITVARQVLARNITDLYELIGGGPRPGITDFAVKMKNAAILRFTDILTALATGLTTNINAAGADLTVDDVYDALYTLIRARVPAPYTCILAPIQRTDFASSLRGETGAIQYVPATAAMLGAGTWQGYGYAGSWNGVDFIDCDSVATVGPDRVGMMFGKTCFGWKDGVPVDVLQYAAPGSYITAMPEGGSLFVEFGRLVRAANTEVVGNFYVGVSELEDNRGVKITSSAT